ncbi:MAG: sigma 54-interacting transcriptional regulator [Myxococcota bacterium]
MSSSPGAPEGSQGSERAPAEGSIRRRGDRLVGTSRSVQRAQEQIAVAGRGRFPVFITGEEGVDKELVARLIHAASEWATGGFFALDASLVPETLLGRELLGSELAAIASLPAEAEGAFTRVGSGTVLLEHVEAVPKELQQTLAVAIEEGRYRRLGGGESRALESRLIASSIEPLESLTSSGGIVPELSRRLVLNIELDALRDRRDDILPLAAHALAVAREEIEHELGRPCPVRGFTREALERLREHNWPGNERELREQIRSALRLARGEEVGTEDLLLGGESTDQIASFRDAKRAFEHEYVTRILRLCKGNISRAARIAKKDRKDFYDVMRRNSIDPQEFRNQ